MPQLKLISERKDAENKKGNCTSCNLKLVTCDKLFYQYS